jgi:5,10-methylene-tetrahydrofolate dehydrogenase/methenyl tetrahydrofolate cyclohydrolase
LFAIAVFLSTTIRAVHQSRGSVNAWISRYSISSNNRRLAASLPTELAGGVLRHSKFVVGKIPISKNNISMSTEAISSLAHIIDGKAIAAVIQDEIKKDVELMLKNHGVTPGLAVILVGQRRDSQTYVKMKKKACAEVGISSFGFDYGDQVTQAEILQKVRELNQDPLVHGILIQLPLPRHLHEPSILHAISPAKDVDGLHPLNAASLAAMATHATDVHLNWKDLNSIPFPIACTPQGCIELLDRSGVEIEGKHAVVVGRSNLVGLPLSLLLLHRNATVTIVHSKTRDASSVVRQGDIVVAAVGRPGLVTSEWLKPGCVVIDVGINSVDTPHTKKGYKLVGDVDFASAQQVCSKITPVPGGVGPTTIAMLLRNTMNACKRHLSEK